MSGVRELNVFVKRHDAWCTAHCAELPDVAGQGATYSECIDDLRAAVEHALSVQRRVVAPESSRFVLVTERERTIAEIHAAFERVTRAAGVSWAEADQLDGYGWLDEERSAARASDPERPWVELVDDPSWDPSPGAGRWSFLDAAGFRYYLPAAMIRCLRSGYDEGIQFHLTLRAGQLRDYTLKQWSALDGVQNRCIARFIECMILICDSDIDRRDWRESGTYWQRFA